MKDPADPVGPMRFAGAGLELAGSVLICMLIGYFIDSYTQTEIPWGVAAGAAIGFIAGMYRFIRLANQLNR